MSCVKPEGALYAFPRLDPEVYDIHDDEQLVLDLLLQEKILVTQGTGFNWPTPDHFRVVFFCRMLSVVKILVRTAERCRIRQIKKWVIELAKKPVQNTGQ